MYRYCVILLKLALSAGLVWYAFSKIDAASAFVYLKVIPLYTVALALALLLFQYAAAALRLRELLKSLKSSCGLLAALDIAMIGAFFSQTFISFVGGDAMRIWRIVKRNISVGTAAKAVLFDRIFGFAGLVLLIVLGLPVLWGMVTDPHMRGSLVLLLSMAVVAWGVFMSMNRLPAALRRWRIFNIAADVATTAQDMTRQIRPLLSVIGLSVAIQLFNVAVIFTLAKGFSVEISFLQCFVLVPPVLFLSMMPISFAGWGVREGAMIVALKLIDVPPSQSLALSISYGLCLVAVSLPGGVLWFVSRRRSARSGDEASILQRGGPGHVVSIRERASK